MQLYISAFVHQIQEQVCGEMLVYIICSCTFLECCSARTSLRGSRVLAVLVGNAYFALEPESNVQRFQQINHTLALEPVSEVISVQRIQWEKHILRQNPSQMSRGLAVLADKSYLALEPALEVLGFQRSSDSSGKSIFCARTRVKVLEVQRFQQINHTWRQNQPQRFQLSSASSGKGIPCTRTRVNGPAV